MKIKELDLSNLKLSLRHMDLCRRNILVDLPSMSITFVDWGCAGFYPMVFELSYIEDLRGTDVEWFEPLLNHMEAPSLEEKAMIVPLFAPGIISMRYA